MSRELTPFSLPPFAFWSPVTRRGLGMRREWDGLSGDSEVDVCSEASAGCTCRSPERGVWAQRCWSRVLRVNQVDERLQWKRGAAQASAWGQGGSTARDSSLSQASDRWRRRGWSGSQTRKRLTS